MKSFTMTVAGLFMSLASLSWAGDNAGLARIYEQDQADRRPNPDGINWSAVSARDTERQKEVLAMLSSGGVVTAADYFHAAMVFQHGRTPEDIALAFSLATVAWRIDANHARAKWLTAAAMDRLLMRKNKPQWYGTQFTRNRETDKWELYTVDENAVSDQERERMGVPSLATSRERATQMNAK